MHFQGQWLHTNRFAYFLKGVTSKWESSPPSRSIVFFSIELNRSFLERSWCRESKQEATKFVSFLKMAEKSTVFILSTAFKFLFLMLERMDLFRFYCLSLTHLCLASLKRGICKQNRPWSDIAERRVYTSALNAGISIQHGNNKN